MFVLRTAIRYGAPILVALSATAAVGWWVVGYWFPPPVPLRPLGNEQFPALQASAPQAPAATGASFNRPEAQVPETAGLWPWFRGADRSNIAETGAAAFFAWTDAAPPPTVWSAQMGEGYAAPAVRNSRVYVIDYDQAGQSDAVRCFALGTGEEIWRRSYPVTVKRNHGMSRTIPAVTDKYVVTLGPKCHLTCLDALTGTIVWQHDLPAEFGVTVPEWYAGQCPLIDGDRVILGTGGKGLVTAFNLATGATIWQTPNPRNWTMTHSSVTPVEIGGVRQYVWCGSGGIAGVAAADGKLLWENPDWVISTATVPTPIVLGPDRLFLSGGYDSGAAFLKVTASAGAFKATIEKRLPASVFGSEQQTPILYKDHIYGVKPGGQLVCLDRTGKLLWNSGTDRFGLGPYIITDGMILAMSDSGTLMSVRAEPTGYVRTGKAKVLEGPEAWGPMAQAGPFLLARDLRKMVCLNIGAKR